MPGGYWMRVRDGPRTAVVGGVCKETRVSAAKDIKDFEREVL
jgi:hypothetical protein